MESESEKKITKLEVEINQAFALLLEKLEAVRWARAEVTDPGELRRGWGLDQGLKDFYQMAEEVIYALKSNATEFGMGVTREQQRLLEAMEKLCQEMEA